MATCNCLFSHTSENPHELLDWCVLVKLSDNLRNYPYSRSLACIRQINNSLIIHKNQRTWCTMDFISILKKLLDNIWKLVIHLRIKTPLG